MKLAARGTGCTDETQLAFWDGWRLLSGTRMRFAQWELHLEMKIQG
jgi:hypothetical protein